MYQIIDHKARVDTESSYTHEQSNYNYSSNTIFIHKGKGGKKKKKAIQVIKKELGIINSRRPFDHLLTFRFLERSLSLLIF